MKTKPYSILVAAIAAATTVMAAEKPQERTHHRSERLAAWHSTVVAVDETVPNKALMTYITDRPTHTERYMLAKVVRHRAGVWNYFRGGRVAPLHGCAGGHGLYSRGEIPSRKYSQFAGHDGTV